MKSQMESPDTVVAPTKRAERTAFREEKRNLLGVLINPVDYETVIGRVIKAAKERRPCTVSALAVHGTMTGALDPQHKYRLNQFDLLVPDGQPVRWALNILHRAGLKDRVYGPKLTLFLLEHAERESIPIYLYGTTDDVLATLRSELRKRFPQLVVAGCRQSQFRQLSAEEKLQVVEDIRQSGAGMVFVALGCPRQEVWAYEYREALSVPIIAIGAAFPFIAGTLAQAPDLLQRLGLEWLFRLLKEPKRLWRRYVLLNPAYVCLVGLQSLGRRYDVDGKAPEKELLFG
jgi:N-acetylglucosaminyldiphosphoundecaprenol N-acetyl-beta-D-mannosaminyltransferase